MVNGLATMSDEATWSNWDHMTGECFRGPQTGKQLDWWPVDLTTVAAALQTFSEIRYFPPPRKTLFGSTFHFLHKGKDHIEGDSSFPPGFRATMSHDIDPRLPEMENGLGVIVGGKGKFYPMSQIARGETVEDDWNGRCLAITRSDLDGVLSARWLDDHTRPMQLLSRWYGFAFNWPDCDVYDSASLPVFHPVTRP